MEGMLLTGLIAITHSTCFFIQLKTTCPRDGTTHNGLGTPTSIASQENDHRLTYRPSWWTLFPIWVSLFSDDSSLCLVGKKAKHQRKWTNVTRFRKFLNLTRPTNPSSKLHKHRGDETSDPKQPASYGGSSMVQLLWIFTHDGWAFW